MNKHKWPYEVMCVVLALASMISGVDSARSDNRPKKIRIIYSNDTLGSLEPCGCGGRNQGGLVRRPSLVSALREENPHSIVLDSGNLLPAVPRGSLVDVYLPETVASAMRIAGYDAVGIGQNDILYGESFFKALNGVAIDIIQIDEEPRPEVKPFVVKDMNGIRVGILSFGAMRSSRVSDIALLRARYSALAELRRTCDVLVLLDQSGIATESWLHWAALRFGAPDVVIGGRGRLTVSEAEIVGQTMIAPTSSEGIFIGCLDIEVDNKGKKTIFCTVHPVGPALNPDPKVQALVNNYYANQRHGVPKPRARPLLNPYFPYTDCKGCHQNEYLHWQKSRHSLALVSLRRANRAVPSCLKCHSEKYRSTDSLAIGEDDMQAVECASCHSDVLPHDSKPTRLKTDMKTKCLSCHTPERSQNFDYDKYVKLVRHKHK